MKAVLAFFFSAAAMLAQTTIGGAIQTSELLQVWGNYSLESGKAKGLTISTQFLRVKHEDEGHGTHTNHYIGSIQLGKRFILLDEKLSLTPSVGIATDGERPRPAAGMLMEIRPNQDWAVESHATFVQLKGYNLLISEPAVEVFRKVTRLVDVFGGLDVDYLFERTTVGLNPGIKIGTRKFNFSAGPIFERHFGTPGGHEPEGHLAESGKWNLGAKLAVTFHFGGHHGSAHNSEKH